MLQRLVRSKTAIIVSLSALLILTFSAGVYAAATYKLTLNGKSSATPVINVKGVLYAPIKNIAESLGAKYAFDSKKNTVALTSKPAQAPKPVSKSKLFPVDVKVESGPMTMTISQVTLDPAYLTQYGKTINAVILNVKVDNTSANKVSWYPPQAKMALSTGQQIDTGGFYSDNIGGEFLGNVSKSGKIVFEATSDLTKVASLTYDVSGAFNDSFERVGEDQTVTITLER